MHDAIALEERGVPTAAVVTQAFEHEAIVQRRALGMDGFEPVVITHPLSTLSEEQIAERARDTAAQALARWQARPL